jgi:hypothetical protein
MLPPTSWRTAEDSARWTPNSFAGVAELRHRLVRKVHDYGMFEPKEAQYLSGRTASECQIGVKPYKQARDIWQT